MAGAPKGGAAGAFSPDAGGAAWIASSSSACRAFRSACSRMTGSTFALTIGCRSFAICARCCSRVSNTLKTMTKSAIRSRPVTPAAAGAHTDRRPFAPGLTAGLYAASTSRTIFASTGFSRYPNAAARALSQRMLMTRGMPFAFAAIILTAVGVNAGSPPIETTDSLCRMYSALSSALRGRIVARTAMRCLSDCSRGFSSTSSNSGGAANTIWISLYADVSRLDSRRMLSSVSTGMFWASSMTTTKFRPCTYSSTRMRCSFSTICVVVSPSASCSSSRKIFSRNSRKVRFGLMM